MGGGMGLSFPGDVLDDVAAAIRFPSSGAVCCCCCCCCCSKSRMSSFGFVGLLDIVTTFTSLLFQLW